MIILVAEIGGPDTAGVGFGLGIERLLLILEAKGIEIPKPETCDVFIACLGDAAKSEGLKISKNLRENGLKVLSDVCDRGLKAQFKYADRLNAKYTVVIGDDELAKGVVSLRDMNNSSQEEVAIDKLLERVK